MFRSNISGTDIGSRESDLKLQTNVCKMSYQTQCSFLSSKNESEGTVSYRFFITGYEAKDTTVTKGVCLPVSSIT
jgi:hypothetical protein